MINSVYRIYILYEPLHNAPHFAVEGLHIALLDESNPLIFYLVLLDSPYSSLLQR